MIDTSHPDAIPSSTTVGGGLDNIMWFFFFVIIGGLVLTLLWHFWPDIRLWWMVRRGRGQPVSGDKKNKLKDNEV